MSASSPTASDRYKAAITIGMAAITGNYEGTVIISDKVRAHVVHVCRSKDRAGRGS